MSEDKSKDSETINFHMMYNGSGWAWPHLFLIRAAKFLGWHGGYMSKDKHSENHSIEVSGSTGTLTVDGNLEITGTVGSVETTGTLKHSTAITQILRFPVSAFFGSTTTGASIVQPGYLDFNTSLSTLWCPVLGLPHGAIIQGMRAIATALSTDDHLIITLEMHYFARDSGSGQGAAGTFATISYANEGVHNQYKTDMLSTPRTVDYTNDEVFQIKIVGDEDTTKTILSYVDIIYTIQTFNQDTGTSPVV